jgi:hypothetical protein
MFSKGNKYMTYDVKKVVEIDINDIIGTTIDDFNDHLCDLTGEPYLQDISWEVSGADDGIILLTVLGWVEEEE